MVSTPTKAVNLKSAQPQSAAPATQRAILQGIRWQTYQALLNDLGDHRAARLTYTQGILEIAMPSKLHEIVNRLMARIVTTLTEELELEIVDAGSTTLDREDLQHGAEPDTCFYIQNAARLQGLDPDIPDDLPPDLVLEIDITSSSTQRLKTYQKLGVPEVWQYTQKQGVAIHQRRGESPE